jgi:signal peptidase II|nr:signal peptidase II [Kofleriaceae bacterium]
MSDDTAKPQSDEPAKPAPEAAVTSESAAEDDAESEPDATADAAPAKKKAKPPPVVDPGEMRRRWIIFTVVAIISLAADQATKIWARATLPTVGHGAGEGGACVIPDDIMIQHCIGKPVSIIDGFWHWRLSMNPGSAFGLFSSGGAVARIGLSIIGIAAVIGMFAMLRKARPDQKILHWALALIASGAVGNLIDRLYYGVVTDFILWHVGEPRADHLSWEHEWPVFNVADVVLVIGVGLMVIDMLQDWKRDRAKRARRRAKARAAGLIRDL